MNVEDACNRDGFLNHAQINFDRKLKSNKNIPQRLGFYYGLSQVKSQHPNKELALFQFYN